MTAATLPHWDVTTVHESLESPAFAADFSATLDAIGELAARFDALGIDKHAAAPLSGADIAAFEEVTTALGRLLERLTTLRAFVYSYVSTDSRNSVAQARLSEFQQRSVLLDQLITRFTAWIGDLEIESLITRSPLAAEHTHMVRRAAEEARHLMSPAEESLAAELSPTGGGAWNRLHADVSSQLLVPITLDGEERSLPMTVVRNLAYSADGEKRRVGYEAELAAWKRSEVPLAAAMNSIKGEVGVLARRRGWESPLQNALFDNAIDQATLDAMLAAAHESFPDFRRYLRAKARMLGKEQLPWYDLFAPVGGDAVQPWTFDAAQSFILRHFGSFAPHMAALA
jgi:oligoendopeptidase F